MSQSQPPGGHWSTPKRHLEVPEIHAEGDRNHAPWGRAASPKRLCTPENIDFGFQNQVWGVADDQGGFDGSLLSTVGYQSVLSSEINVWNDWRPPEDIHCQPTRTSEISARDSWQLSVPDSAQLFEGFNYDNIGTNSYLPPQPLSSSPNPHQDFQFGSNTEAWMSGSGHTYNGHGEWPDATSLSGLENLLSHAQDFAFNQGPTDREAISQSGEHRVISSLIEATNPIWFDLSHGGQNEVPSRDYFDTQILEVSPPKGTEETALKDINDGSIEATFDTCFGMIVVEGVDIEEDILKRKGRIDVKLQIGDSATTIRDTKSSSYCGLVNQGTAQVLTDLLNKYPVKLSSTIEESKGISVLVYGNEEDGDSIGDFLLDRDCFLQHPETFDPCTVYRNCQMLLRPGADFVSTGLADVTSAQTPQPVSKAVERSKIAELLDSASGPATFTRVEPSSMLKTVLKKHQLQALSMMTEKESGVLLDSEFPSLWTEIPSSGSSRKMYQNNITGTTSFTRPMLCLGGLLADEMGLGKTLTILALVAGGLHDQKQESQATLVVAPLSTITNWEDQIERHTKDGSMKYLVYHGPGRRKHDTSIALFDIVLTTYETLRRDIFPSSSQKGSCLGSTEWLRVVLDEAHVIRNRRSKLFKAVNRLKSRHRWCVTGTPIQNTVEDLGGIVGFLRAYPFDDVRQFRSVFLDSMHKADASGWAQLRRLIQAIALRRTKALLNAEIRIPLKTHVIVPILLDANERKLYDIVKLRLASTTDTKESFNLALRLRQICNHGPGLLPAGLQSWLDEVAPYSDDSMPQMRTCEVCNAVFTDNTANVGYLSCAHQLCLDCVQYEELATSEKRPFCPICDFTAADRYKSSVFRQPENSNFKISSKVGALLDVLESEMKESVAGTSPPIKSVAFSIWTGMLDLIGKAFVLRDIPYYRLDGSNSLLERRQIIDNFRESYSFVVLLTTIGSAGVGLDLTIASKVHIIKPR